MSIWSFARRSTTRSRRAAVLASALLPAALVACNAIIGTEDRFLAPDAGAMVSDAQASDVGPTDDGSTIVPPGADSALPVDDAGADGGETDACVDGGVCTLPGPIAVFPAITTFDLDVASGTLYIAPGGAGAGIYTTNIADQSASPMQYWADVDAGAGDHTVVKMHATSGGLYFIEHSTTNNTNYLHACPLAPAGCSTSPLVRLVSAGVDFFVGNQALFWWGGDEIDYVPISTPMAASFTSTPLAGVTSFLGGAAGLVALGSGGVTRYTPSGQVALANPVTDPTVKGTSVLSENGTVFVANPVTGGIVALSVTFGASDMGTVVASNQPSPTNIATDGANLFWLTAPTTGSPASLVGCAISGGGDAGAVSCVPSPIHAFRNPTALLVTSSAFFVQDTLPLQQAIYLLPR